MLSDVDQGESAKKSVAERVYRNIAVRVCDASHRAFNLYSAQPYRQSFSEGVYVISVTDSDIHTQILSTKVNKNN